MENTDFIERIAHLEEQNKSNTKRIDEHDERIEKLEEHREKKEQDKLAREDD